MESEINKLPQEERDKQELENLKQGYIQCKETYKIALIFTSINILSMVMLIIIKIGHF